MNNPVPSHIKNYVILEQIGEGGMGIVYRGQDTLTQQIVAIKHLKSTDANLVSRFIREGEALRQLNHPSIVKMMDALEENQQHYLVMEYVEGGSLTQLLKQEAPLPLARVLDIALDLSDALTRAHRLNIIHRDIKPDNILIATDGTPRLTDFGIARVQSSHNTQTGTIIGTLEYISPEVLSGGAIDIRSDIWSFGVLLFEMICGVRPFQSESLAHLMQQILIAPLPDIEAMRPDLPIALVDLLHRMLAKTPAERIPSVRLVGAELEGLLRGTVYPPTSSPPHPATDAPPLNPPTVVIGERFSTPVPVTQVRHNLPVQTTPFVGRENELQEIARLLEDPQIRLVTIQGPGGMGKTRLSLEVARAHLEQFPNGVYFVELAALATPEAIVTTIAEAVGYPFQQDSRTPHQQILDYAREKTLLLVMDNFEHLIGGATIVSDLLKVAPDVKFIATSRQKLNLQEEVVFNLEGMDFPDWQTPTEALEYSAVKLFMQSAKRVRVDFELQAGDLGYVAQICQHVYGMPLAILLAAAWLETLRLDEIVAELKNSQDFLETDQQDLPERQRSLRAVFDYSWALLSENERATFSQLAIFRDGFTRQAAEKVAGASLRGLTSLVNKSLLRRDVATGRYTIHELLRQYAEEMLKQSGQWASTHIRCVICTAEWVANSEADLKGNRQLPAIQEFEADFENIKDAWLSLIISQNESQLGKMVEAVYWFTHFRGRFIEGKELFQKAREVWSADKANPSLLAGRLLVRYPENQPDMLPIFEKASAIANQYQHPFESAFCERLLGHWYSHSLFNQEVGVPLLYASLQRFQALGDDFYAATVLDDLGWSYNIMNDMPKAAEIIQQSLQLRRKIGDKIGTVSALRSMGAATGGYGSLRDEPLHYWQEALQLAREVGDRSSIAWNTFLIGALWVFRGEFAKARPWIIESYKSATDINEKTVSGLCLIVDAYYAALLDEDYGKADLLLQEGYPAGSPGDVRAINVFLGNLIIACGLGDYQRFRTTMNKRRIWDFVSVRWSAGLLPILIACLAVDMGEKELAAQLLGVALLHPESKSENMFTHWGVAKRLRASLESELGMTTYQQLLQEGATQNPQMLMNRIVDRLPPPV